MTKLRWLVLIGLLFMTTPNVVYGNAGPTYHGKYPGVNLVPIYNNQIVVREEQIIFDISTNSRSFDTVQADVSVHYLFENTSELEETVLVAFPFDSSNSFLAAKSNINIFFDGAAVDYIISGSMIDYDYSGDYIGYTRGYDTRFEIDYRYLPFSDILAYLINEVQSDKLVSSGAGNTKVILFELTFLPSKQHNLLVTYEALPSMKMDERAFYFITTPWHPEFIYYLEPAKYWAGFEDLTISIYTPNNFPLGEINLPEIVEVESGHYRGHFDTLPDQNLVFSLVDKKDVMRMYVGIYLWINVLVALLLVLLLPVFLLVRKIYRGLFKR